MEALQIIQHYYEAFNAQNWTKMLDLVAPTILHEPNQGSPRVGIELFKEFMHKMDVAYTETLTGMEFYVNTNDPSKIAATFTVNGVYKMAEEGLPAAYGQSYVLPASAFLEVKDGKITKVATNYNLEKWIELVSK